MLLNSLHIKGFRGFTDFKVEGLGQVNLIIGRNNAGKTTLLEAIGLLQTDVDLPAIERDEPSPDAVLNLFYGRPSANRIEEFEISSDQRSAKVSLANRSFRIDRGRNGSSDATRVEGASGFFNTVGSPVLIEPGAPSPNFVELWDRIVFTPYHDDVRNCLKLIVPDIEDVTLSSTHRNPIVRLAGSSAPVSMASLGGGATRLFQLACGLVVSNNNVFLVDEIENGLHHSIHADMWKFVFTVAERYDVQVFATTHGLDCLRGFARASLETDVSAKVIRLENRKGEVGPVLFDERQFQIAAREEIEIR